MTKSKNQSVKLNKVVLDNVDAAVVVVTKVDNRSNNPGRPVNKQSARYKRLAKQRFYARVNSMFVGGKAFTLGKNQSSEYHYTKNISGGGGSLFNGIGNHVCSIDYVGRTKVTGCAYVLNKRVNVAIDLKQVKFTA